MNDALMTPEQRRKMNAMLGDVSRQIQWSINGYMRNMCKDDWRRWLAAHIRHQPTCESIDGDFLVVLSVSTKEFSVSEAQRAIDLLQAFGDQRQVQWTDPNYISQMKQAQEIQREHDV